MLQRDPVPSGVPASPHDASAIDEKWLGLALAFVAGAANAGGFLLVGIYTSHMSGVVAGIADDLILGARAALSVGLMALSSFIGGAAFSAVQINWSRRHLRSSPYAMPLLTEAGLLLVFGIVGSLAPQPAAAGLAIPLLCFLMGLQNATITKISGARIRTTHITGIVTDIGIELGKLVYWNRRDDLAPPVIADRAKLFLLAGMFGCFVAGALAGAVGFSQFGFVICLPLAGILALLAQRIRSAE